MKYIPTEEQTDFWSSDDADEMQKWALSAYVEISDIAMDHPSMDLPMNVLISKEEIDEILNIAKRNKPDKHSKTGLPIVAIDGIRRHAGFPELRIQSELYRAEAGLTPTLKIDF